MKAKVATPVALTEAQLRTVAIANLASALRIDLPHMAAGWPDSMVLEYIQQRYERREAVR